jgi:hypothetical protein
MIGGVLLKLGKSMWAISFINGAVEDKKRFTIASLYNNSLSAYPVLHGIFWS